VRHNDEGAVVQAKSDPSSRSAVQPAVQPASHDFYDFYDFGHPGFFKLHPPQSDTRLTPGAQPCPGELDWPLEAWRPRNGPRFETEERCVADSATNTPTPQVSRVVADASEVARVLARMAHEILEANHGADNLILLGIPTRGVHLARRLARLIEDIEGSPVRLGELDITMYRDDLRGNPTRNPARTAIPGSIDNAVVVLVDDVLYSGRTIGAAFDALRDLGRPKAVRLAVLVDRGHRELPIAADAVGRTIQAAADERVSVLLGELDTADAITITRVEREA
jgi:pyrimidine operon attenuation protein / uracil phosphoribosyltransferase